MSKCEMCKLKELQKIGRCEECGVVIHTEKPQTIPHIFEDEPEKPTDQEKSKHPHECTCFNVPKEEPQIPPLSEKPFDGRASELWG